MRVKNPLPIVAVVTTGGSIAQKIDPKTNTAIPTVSGVDLIKSIPIISNIANVEVFEFSNIDSSQMTPDLWLKLSTLVNDILKKRNVSGVVVTHGTDTMPEGAYFLDLTVQSNKPVVFTGAMRDISECFSDGPENVYNSILQAASSENYNWGVTVNIDHNISSSRDIRKAKTYNVQAFNPGQQGYLGAIIQDKIMFFHDRIGRLHFPSPEKLANVILIKSYSGDNGDLVRAAIKLKVDGIVIEGFGTGNVNAMVYDALEEAINKNIVVVVSSSVESGGVYPIYGTKGGSASLYKLGAILGGNLQGAKARVLLMLALPKIGNHPEKLKKYFSREYG